MEKNILVAGILILALGAALFAVGSTTAGILVLTVGSVDSLAVIFWPQLTKTPSRRNDYSLGNQVLDTLFIVSGVALTATTEMFVFLALIVCGIASLVYRYRQDTAVA